MRQPQKDQYEVALVMLTNLGRADGGRETWAYNFIPLLLNAEKRLTLRLFGLRTETQPDNTLALSSAISAEDRDRLKPRFFRTRRSRMPLFFAMLHHLRTHMKAQTAACPRYSLGVGSVMEMLMLLAAPKLRSGFKVMWLRTILFDQKSDKIPLIIMPIVRRLEAWILSRAQLILANGDDIAHYYASYGLNVKVIRNGVCMRKWSLPTAPVGQPLRVAFIGRLSAEKGIMEFIATAAAIRKSPDGGLYEFHTFGDGPFISRVLEAEAAGLLVHRGAVDNNDLPVLLDTIDVCVAFTFASRVKGGGGTSNALMEQMAAGRVIIAWDNVIFRQLLDDDTAYLVPQGEVGGVVAALHAIAHDRAEARRRAIGAKASIAPYSLEAQVEKFLKIMRDVEA